jgi:small subunit ribosomal protein S2
MADVGIRELLESGVHFGHQTRRWNPKMRRFIHGERGGIYIIDLLKTQVLLQQAQEFAAQLSHRGGTILFVGTKKQARDAVKETAESCGMPYVNHRWLGGLLTNYQTIQNRIKRLHDLERYQTEGQLALLPTRERMSALADLEKLQANLGGVKNMQRPPDAVFVIDLKTEVIAVREAQRLRIPIIGLVDTNCDPDGIDYVIPGNDDAIRACSVIAGAIGSVVTEGAQAWRQQEEERQRRDAEEQARRAAEDQQRRAAEEQARREEEQRRRDAAQAQATASAEPQGTPQPQVEAEAKVHTTSRDKNVAEAQVAEARQAEGRPQPDAAAAVQPKATKTVAPTGKDVPGGSPDTAVPAEETAKDPASAPETPITDVIEENANANG